jgi:hypothetical protein
MKRLWVCVLGTFYWLLTLSGLSFATHNTPIDSRAVSISNITQDTPLYLEHSEAIHSNPVDVMQSWHYSHSSHYSHESHYSHQSHYSHYSSR